MQIISMYNYSLLLSLGTLAIAAAVVISLLCLVFSPSLREKLLSVNYYFYIKLIAFIAITSALGALIYQYYYETPVCVLCWWQRIFIFPIGIVALVGLRYKEKAIHLSTTALAFFGLIFASYHYYGHFQIYVQEKSTDIFSTCDAYGTGEPSCASTPFELFGFITIPFMSMIALTAILWLSYLAYRAQKMQP